MIEKLPRYFLTQCVLFSLKLMSIIEVCKRKSNNQMFVLCIQETKLMNLTNILINILRFNQLEYCITPANKKSGGLLTVWSKDITDAYMYSSHSACHVVHFLSFNFYLCNTYLNRPEHTKESHMLQRALSPLHSKPIVLVGDLNCFNYDEANSSFPIRICDPRISH